MSLDARLNRLTPALSVQERAILILRSWKEKSPEDPALRRTMPAAQLREFNRLIGLMNACGIHLPIYITLVEQRAEQLYLRFSAQQTLVRFGTSLWEVAKLVPAAKRPRAEKLVSDFPLADLPWDPEDHEESWLNVAERSEQALRIELGLLWQELRAIDAVVGDVRGEFNDEDPLQPVMRAVLEDVRSRLAQFAA